MPTASLPRLGLGMAALGRPGYITLDRNSILGEERPVDVMQTQADQVMDKLFELSSSNNNENNNMLPWLDCARSYGLSEKFVGEYLRKKNIPKDSVYVSSKWGYSEYSFSIFELYYRKVYVIDVLAQHDLVVAMLLLQLPTY